MNYLIAIPILVLCKEAPKDIYLKHEFNVPRQWVFIFFLYTNFFREGKRVVRGNKSDKTGAIGFGWMVLL